MSRVGVKLPARACACTLASIGFVGCGASHGGLTRSALIPKADAICARTDALAARAAARIHVAHDPDGPRQAFIATARATIPISDRGLSRLRALKPPGQLRSDWQRFLTDVQKENAAARALLLAARQQNTISAAETQQSLQAAQLDLQAVTTKDGFRVCGKAAHV